MTQEELEQQLKKFLAVVKREIDGCAGEYEYCLGELSEDSIIRLINLLADSELGWQEDTTVTCPYCEREVEIGDCFIPIEKEVEG